MRRYDGKSWQRTAAQFTVEVLIAMAFLYLWIAISVVIFLSIAWLVGKL